MAMIEMLNYDVLREIFSYLDVFDQVRMGLVCKKWHNVVEIMMGSIHKVCLYMVRHDPYSIKIQNDVLEVCTNDWTNMEKPFEKFASNLHKIRIMDLGKAEISPSIYTLLQKCTNLTYARLDCYRCISVGYFLDFLPTDNLEDLSIILRREFEDEFKNCPQNSHMDKVLANSPKLKSLELNNVPVTELSSIGGMETLKALYIDVVELPRLSFDKKKLRNLETLGMVYEQVDSTANLIEIIRTCKKIHSVKFGSCDTSYDIILNEMISLPNLRRVCLENDPCESWYKFSNLESIHMMFSTPVSVTRDQVKSFLQRSKNLKTYNAYYRYIQDLFEKELSDIGHECKITYINKWADWCSAIPFY